MRGSHRTLISNFKICWIIILLVQVSGRSVFTQLEVFELSTLVEYAYYFRKKVVVVTTQSYFYLRWSSEFIPSLIKNEYVGPADIFVVDTLALLTFIYSLLVWSFNLLFLFPTMVKLLYTIINYLAQLYEGNNFLVGNLTLEECGLYKTNILHLVNFLFADVKCTDSYHQDILIKCIN